MCFSKNVSLFTFISGVIGGILCYSTGVTDYKIIGLFFIFISLMQGIEYLLWINQECNDYNKFLTKCAMILNHLQPIILFILLYIYSSKFDNKLFLVILVYLIIIIPYSLQLNESSCTLKNKSNHLNWEWNYMDYYYIVYTYFVICLMIFGFFFENKVYGNLFILFTLLSYSASFFIYDKTKVVGSMWCFFSVFAPLLFYIFIKTKVV
jgi:hypothetical protein